MTKSYRQVPARTYKILQRAEFDIVKRDDDSNTYEVSGYLSTYGEDSVGDVLEQGCYDTWLKNVKDIPMLWSHDRGEVIGKWTEFKLDKKGLYGTGEIYGDIQRGVEAHTLVKRGAVSGISIGAMLVDWFFDKEWNLHIVELDIKEASLVLFPAQEDAQVDTIKELKQVWRTKMLDTDAGTGGDKSTDKDVETVLKQIANLQENFNKQVEALKGLDADTIVETVTKSVTDTVDKSLDDKVDKAIDLKNVNIIKSVQDNTKQLDKLAKLLDKGSGVGTFEFVKKTDEKTNQTYLSLDIGEAWWNRAVQQIDNVPGTRVTQAQPWYELQNMDVFGQVAMSIPAGSPTFNLPRGSTGEFEDEETLVRHSAAVYEGALANQVIATKNRTHRTMFSEASFDDLPGLQQIIRQETVEKSYAFTSVKAALALSTSFKKVGNARNDFDIVKVKTDTDGVAANATLDGNNVLIATSKTKRAIPSKYRAGAVWVISKDLEEILETTQQGNSGPYGFNPKEGIMKLHGYPVLVSDDLNISAPAVKDDVYGYFGNFRQALLYATYKPLEIRIYTETEPGAFVIRSTFRWVAVVRNGKAVAALAIDT